MRFTIANEDDVLPFDLPAESTTVAQLKQSVNEFGGPSVQNQVLILDGKPLAPDTATLAACGVAEDCVIMVVDANLARAAGGNAAGESQATNPPTTEAQIESAATRAVADIKQRLQRDTDGSFLAQLLENDSELGEAALSESESDLLTLVRGRVKLRADAHLAEQRRLASLADADPFDMEAQAQIAEEIRKHNVEENYGHAIEELPEAFGRVVMLYVDTHVNGVPVKAFVDSGAQSTIMSKECAEQCGIMRLIDTRFAGMAMGVGTARILGRVHVAPLVIGSSHFPSSFTVMDDNKVGFLLGLDMLKRHQACIDLRESVLRIGTETVPFLSESEIPKSEFNYDDSELEKEEAALRNQPPARQPQQPQQQQQQPQPAQATQQPQPSQQTSHPSATPVSEDSITKLVQLTAASRDRVVQALQRAGGNEDFAAAELMGLF